MMLYQKKNIKYKPGFDQIKYTMAAKSIKIKNNNTSQLHNGHSRIVQQQSKGKLEPFFKHLKKWCFPTSIAY
jgi:hypothetical protein